MEAFRIVGGAPLQGGVRVAGAKNSVLKLMSAALLTEGTTTLVDVPDILDVRIMVKLLTRLGCGVDYVDGSGMLSITTPAVPGHKADYDLVRAMRASISVLGPLLARCGAAQVALPGGDAIGSRGLDMHVSGLEALGAKIAVEHGFLVAEAPGGLRGAEIRLDFPSVGATENLLMAAVLANGRTVLDNVAREPEVVDLCRMLRRMGAKIDGVAGSTLEIIGTDSLSPVEHRVVPDRIVAGTWAFAAAITGGDVIVHNGEPGHLELVIDKLVDAGSEVITLADGFRVKGAERPKAVDVATLPYPGFPTDLQPFMVTLCAVSGGAAMITENLFEARFRFVQEIARLGAHVRMDGHHAFVRGVPKLSGAPVEASDIRAGAALVLAGLVAEGETIVYEAGHVDRGYDRFDHALRTLGADVRRFEVNEAPAAS
ncbi:UDP-N-acetylglucosamine 1-carboxyvinyltransferase [Kineosporia rhizophila]|uniref:UDP-N-acetylglucosamine 1-carboxyvinyltransferase n=1 Tax=Kineosporia TaxID=49184 RepID=UPI001E4DE32E|nr:UDP-N-acetylglucosamine 1-carboxyvinyltransferase [Kineosporia sp. NBRC 101677]MCE0539022.1 UDP-N-acetylglucosamine 1-carboxyvinyltransferase [Kineosporia rhizophila]GLY17876.1 UDP-N-acetylglucosamine 1-carboxyvinyltransferase [Kineosporia sp. NBRC 101677]